MYCTVKWRRGGVWVRKIVGNSIKSTGGYLGMKVGKQQAYPVNSPDMHQSPEGLPRQSTPWWRPWTSATYLPITQVWHARADQTVQLVIATRWSVQASFQLVNTSRLSASAAAAAAATRRLPHLNSRRRRHDARTCFTVQRRTPGDGRQLLQLTGRTS